MINNNEKIKELISSYIDGFVTPEEKKQVEDLIINSKEWQEYYKELTRLSTTLKRWPDEEVSADMANKIQKTLLDDKLREGSDMNRKTMLTLGGGVLATMAVCFLIGSLYMKTYSEKAIQRHVEMAAYESTLSGSRQAAYEPYYLTGEYHANNGSGSADQFVQSSAAGSPQRELQAGDARVTETKRDQDGYDLATQYNKEPAPQEKQRLEAALDKKIQAVTAPQPEPIVRQVLERKANEGYDLAKNYEAQSTSEQSQTSGAGGKLSAIKDEVRAPSSGGYQTSTYDPNLGMVDAAAPAQAKKELAQADQEYWGGGVRSNVKGAERGALNANQLAKSKVGYGYAAPAAAPGVIEEGEIRRRDAGRAYYEADESYHVGNGPVIYPDDSRYYGDRVIYYPQPTEPAYPSPNTEEYASIYENPFFATANMPLSTFSIDVDTASYSNVRRFVEQGQLPPADAVRIEEMINYFDYNYEKPKWGDPFSVTTRAAVCPWNQAHYLVMVGLQGNVPTQNKIPPSNLVFLIDVSGSMNQANKLPLLKQSLKMLVDQLRPDQKVAIVTYSGSARLYLDATSGAYKARIHAAIDNLTAGGSTSGEAGLKLAYRVAHDNFVRNGNNRIILATDGDFNVGMQNDYELVEFIKQRRQEGVFLSILGFGTGNYKDAKLEKIADNGNGQYSYIDTIEEGRKVLVEELGSTLFTIAKDVKIQVEFNPQFVHSYRLIGYENRVLNQEDFNNDRVDAGEIGAGHTVTALYEIVPAGAPMQAPYPVKGVDPLKYQKRSLLVNNELMTVKLRFKAPKSEHSQLIKKVVRTNDVHSYLSDDFQFAAAVAEFGLLLRNSQYRGYASYDHVLDAARRSRGVDADRHRAEFVNLVEQAKQLDQRYIYPEPQPYPAPYPYPVYEQYPSDQTPPIQFK